MKIDHCSLFFVINEFFGLINSYINIGDFSIVDLRLIMNINFYEIEILLLNDIEDLVFEINQWINNKDFVSIELV